MVMATSSLMLEDVMLRLESITTSMTFGEIFELLQVKGFSLNKEIYKEISKYCRINRLKIFANLTIACLQVRSVC